MPEEGAFGGPMEAEVGEPGAENSEVTGNSEEMTGVAVVQGDQTTLLLPEAALPVRHEVRVQSMKKYPNDAASVVLKQAVRRMRVTWPPLTRRPPHPRRERLIRSPSPPHHQELPHRQPQPDSLLPGVVVSSLQEECHHVEAEVGGGLLLLSAQAGALQPSPWFQRSLQQVLCPQVRTP